MIRIITYFIIYALTISGVVAQVTSEEIMIHNGAIELPGTLTYTIEKSPLIIWVHGSGNVDRNGNQAGINIKANYIKQFRDAVNKENISFFSFDKRTSNPKNAAFMKDGIYFNDFVFDVQEVVNYFKDDTRFSKIILVGHSQGSLIAMLSLNTIDKYISLAGPSESVDKAIVEQVTAQSPELGKITEAHFKELKETGDIKTVNPFLVSIFAKQNLAFMLSWLKYNPSEEIKKIAIPILIINGDKDLQVKVEDAQALQKANPNSELIIIENMNHVLKNIQNDEDNMKSYYSADFPLSKKLIETVVSFVKE